MGVLYAILWHFCACFDLKIMCFFSLPELGIKFMLQENVLHLSCGFALRGTCTQV